MDHHFLHVADRADEALDPTAALEFVSDPGFGGITMFVGRVRDLNHGRQVAGISYDLYQPLALARFAQIAEQVQSEVGPRLRLYIAHAKGRLAVGELAVVIAAGTPHRDEAFRACRLAIEAVKHTTPIWKQEHYVDGDSVWSEGCSLCDAPSAQGAQVDVHAHDHDHEHDHESPQRWPRRDAMKLQLQGQRMRLRLDEAELARLLSGEAIVNATELGSVSGFSQSLSLHAHAQPTLQAASHEWRVNLPEAAVREYVQRLPCREALEFALACDGNAVLTLHFEVDVRDSLQLRGARRRGGGSADPP